MITTLNGKPRRPNRICGVFVMGARRKHDGPRVREGLYFPSTLAASQSLGHRSDIVARHLYLSNTLGVARVGGVWFKTAKQMYIDDRGSCGEFAKWLLKQFPFIRERKVIFNDRPRWSKRRARMPDLPYEPKRPAPEPEYHI